MDGGAAVVTSPLLGPHREWDIGRHCEKRFCYAFSISSLTSRSTGSPAFAGDDSCGRGALVFIRRSRRVGKGAPAPCPPFQILRSLLQGWWARLRFAHPTAACKFPIRFSNSQNNFTYESAISRRVAPEALMNLSPKRGRGECRVPVAPAASCALGSGRTHTSNNEYTGIARHSRTQWF